MTIVISTPTSKAAEPHLGGEAGWIATNPDMKYPPIHVERDPHDSNRIIASGPGVDHLMLKLAAGKPPT